MTKDESYFIVKLYGIEQGWSRSTPKVLEKPKPFVGYISGTDWGYSASSERMWAHKFNHIPKVNTKDIGPWYYKISKYEVIEVKRTVQEIETVING